MIGRRAGSTPLMSAVADLMAVHADAQCACKVAHAIATAERPDSVPESARQWIANGTAILRENERHCYAMLAIVGGTAANDNTAYSNQV